MQTLPVELLPLIIEFQPLFSKPVWPHAKLLLVGAILAIGKRTVTSCLRVCGLAHASGFQNYHRVLNRARWSALAASRLLLRSLVAAFAPTGELVCGLDDTIERRRGQRIKAKGIYRDPVRSSHSHFVKASGLRGLCWMLLVEVSWAGGIWGLPFLLRKPGQVGRPRLKGERRPWPRQVLKHRHTKWTKIEVEQCYGGGKRQVEVHSERAIWYKTGQPPVGIRWLLVRDPLAEFEPQALMTTNLDHSPLQMLTWFVRRWRMEVTFAEARAHLGMETQRQWNLLAIARRTPILLGLFSLVTLMANGLIKVPNQAVGTAAW